MERCGGDFITHKTLIDELVDRAKVRGANYIDVERPYYKNDKKIHSDYKGDIDVMAIYDDYTEMYEVKGGSGYFTRQRGEEQLEKAAETFDGQTEHIKYFLKTEKQEYEVKP